MRAMQPLPMKPLPENPSMEDVSKALKQLHESFEEHRTNTRTRDAVHSGDLKKVVEDTELLRTSQAVLVKNQAVVRKQVGRLTTATNKLSKDQQGVVDSLDIIKLALGLQDVTPGEIRPRKPLALMSQVEAFWKGMLAIGGAVMVVVFCIKIISIVFPFVTQMIDALYHTAMKGVF